MRGPAVTEPAVTEPAVTEPAMAGPAVTHRWAERRRTGWESTAVSGTVDAVNIEWTGSGQ